MGKKWIKIISVILLLCIAVFVLSGCGKKEEENTNFKIVTSFYPMYIMLLNITTGAQNIELSNMTDVNIGCLHDYTLRTEDLKKIDEADVFIMNGLGLEDFIQKVLETNQELQVIDSSEEITENYITQVRTIANKLGSLNPENKELYANNAEEYIASINSIKKEYATKVETLRGKKAVCLNESFFYLGKELGMDFITIETNHEESTLSAEMLSSIIEQMKAENITYIILDKDDDMKNAQTLQRETGATIYALDSGLTGSLNKNSYLNSLQGNYRILLGEE